MTADRNQSARSDAERAAREAATDAAERDAPRAPLSVREREILGLLARGENGAQIADSLVLSPETVRTHVRNAMAKLGASSRAHAVALAIQRNEIEIEAAPADAAVAPAGADSGSAPPPASGRARAWAALLGGKSDATLTALLAALVSLYDVESGTVFLADENGLSLRRAAVLGDGDENGDHYHPEQVLLGEGALGRAALERRAQLVHGSGPRGDMPGRSTLCAPMISSGRVVGVIGLTMRPSRLTGRGELLLLQAFANRVGDVLLSAGGDQAGRLKEALERFRSSWSAAHGAI